MIKKKIKRKSSNKEQVREMENKQQDDRFKPHHISNHINVNSLNLLINRQGLSDYFFSKKTKNRKNIQ